MSARYQLTIGLVFAALSGGCGSDSKSPTTGGAAGAGSVPSPTVSEGACQIGAAAPDSLANIACRADFDALASQPLDDSIPGARSGKVVLDQLDADTLYFQNSNKFKIHYDFASGHLSGNGKPIVSSLADFNTSQYFDPDRRFLLAAVTYYDGPKLWTVEIAPYDTMTVTQIEKLFRAVQAKVYFGAALTFHPTSEAVAAEAAKLPPDIAVRSTTELYEGIDYQPLNLGSTIGQLRFVNASELESQYLSFRDIVVLDRVPNDISVVAGLITAEFQTPLAHVNVLAQNRKTPNMGLRSATTNDKLRALAGKWVRLTVNAFDWSVAEVTQAEADADWLARKPAGVTLPAVDMTVTDLRDIDQVTEVPAGGKVKREAIAAAVRAFGAKAANYAVIRKIGNVPIKKAFAIPASYYVTFMQDNGFFARVQQMLADASFRNDPVLRDAQLKGLRDDIKATPLSAGLSNLLKAKLDAEYPGESMRFRSSSNAEDLDGFPCAGCYDSHTGDPADWEGDMLYAIRQTWATVWSFRTFEEREYNGIDHVGVGMALLVHHNFPDEEANGVAVTANPYDPSGLSPGFYVNVQFGGDAEVVAPPEGVTSDSFIYQYSFQGSPIIYLTHSNLVPEGSTVLTARQVHELGEALDAIHNGFSDAYGPGAGNNGWYAMDVEFKFDDEEAPGTTPTLFVKQARPYNGRGNVQAATN